MGADGDARNLMGVAGAGSSDYRNDGIRYADDDEIRAESYECRDHPWNHAHRGHRAHIALLPTLRNWIEVARLLDKFLRRH